jgi:hypothetical protein
MSNPAPIATYKELIDLFRSICLSQLAVKQFQVGQLSDIDNQNVEHTFVRFPLVFMIPTQSSMDRFGKMLLGFSFIVMDIAKDNDEQLQIDTHNNTLMIMQDIFSKFIMTDWLTVGAKIETPIYMLPFVERFNNNLTGWSADISVEIQSPFNLCDAAFPA